MLVNKIPDGLWVEVGTDKAWHSAHSFEWVYKAKLKSGCKLRAEFPSSIDDYVELWKRELDAIFHPQ